jgi:Fic family protein
LFAHKLLLRTINPDIAGRLRHYFVRVGHYLAPDPSEVSSLLLAWIDDVSQWVQFGRVSGDNIDETAKYHHIRFEGIHPFGDGNGRIGRMLMNWFLVKGGRPLLIIHEGEEQFSYYKWFN